MTAALRNTCVGCGFLTLLSLLAGCDEHRISIEEFVAQEQQRQAVATSQPASQPADAQTLSMLQRELGQYKVGPGDTLAIMRYGAQQESAGSAMTLRVDREGNVELPVVGSVPVAGMDMVELDKKIREKLVPDVYRDTVIHVTLVESENTRVLVHGAVVTPGLVQLRRTERNLLFAIVAAGGVSQTASGKVTLTRLRYPLEKKTLNLLDAEELKLALALPALQDGDLVSVEAAVPNTVFVGGLVNAPRPQYYPAGTQVTILQAMAAASGLRTDVTPTEGTLIRHYADGQDVQVKLDLDRLMKGKDPNLTLAAGDVLWIPDTVLTRVQDWVNKNIFVRAGVTSTYNLSYNHSGLDFLNGAARSSQLQNSQNLQDSFDPFGFLLRNQSLSNINNRLPTP